MLRVPWFHRRLDRIRWHAGWFFWVAFLLVLTLFFRKAIFAGELPLFRDGANFFYPLWGYVGEQYRRGLIPLWNPYQNLGIPLAAEGSAGVFYPGIILFVLPLPHDVSYSLFLMIHLALAAWGARHLARVSGASARAANFAGLVYPFSGYVLFQIYNPIYLVSATWLPWFFAACIGLFARNNAPRCTPRAEDDNAQLRPQTHEGNAHLFSQAQDGNAQLSPQASDDNAQIAIPPEDCKSRSRPELESVAANTRRTAAFRGATMLAVPLALMCLGGDPQTAYHCLLIAFVTWGYYTIRAIAPVCLGKRRSSPTVLSRSLYQGGIVLGAAILAGCLAAAQIAITAAYVKESDRHLLEKTAALSPVNVKTVEPDANQSAGGTSPSEGGTLTSTALAWSAAQHESQLREQVTYDFSIPIYRLLEFVWPNFGGRPFPLNARWLAGVFAEGRWWTPSLYFGFFPIVCALSAFRLWRSRLPAKFDPSVLLSWLALLSGLAALGWYGPMSVCQVLVGMISPNCDAFSQVSPPVGGVYWLLVQILPGYDLFRYPSKWLVITTASLVTLAALGFDAILAHPPRRFTRLLWTVLLCSAGMLTLLSLSPGWNEIAGRVPTDLLFGPFNAEVAWQEFVMGASFLMILAILGLLLALPKSTMWPVKYSLVFFLTVIDLAIHNCWLVVAVQPGVLPELRTAATEPPVRFWARWYEYPRSWSLSGRPERLQEVFDWEKQHSRVRWGMLTGQVPVETYGTLMPADTYAFFAVLHQWMRQNNTPIPPAELLTLLGVQPEGTASVPPRLSPIPRDSLGTTSYHRSSTADSPLMTDSRLTTDSPMIAVSHRWRQREDSHHDHASAYYDVATILFPAGRCRTTADPVIVEPPDGRKPQGAEAVLQAEGTVGLLPREHCKLIAFRPGRIVVNLNLREPGVFILREQYLRGWRFTVREAKREKIHYAGPPDRVNGLFMGMVLPPGQYRIEAAYYQAGLFAGLTISIISWLALVGLWTRFRISAFCRNRTSPRASQRHWSAA